MTTTQTEIQIHEFSTGIRPERTADGGWVSLGFTGQYMNATINSVPHAIQRSIANKEFAVAEGASSDEPAIIGRVVSGEDSDWSVVAVVTKGRDEKGRSASLYRYFFCEGDKGVSNLWRIISWIEDYQRSHNGDMPVFNPFDTKDLEQPNLYIASTPSQSNLLPETEASLLSDSAPILIPAEAQYTLQDINRLANKKARPDNNQQPKAIADENHQPIAWAYKVKALEQPRRFQIIQAASDKAYELLQKVKATTPQVVAPLIDEQAFKAAIKGLINSSRVKLEYLQAIAEPLGNDQIPESYWKEIFDSQGANNALKQGIYSPQMVRLLTLRAIVIPETLADYLAWLEKGSKQNDNSTVFADFQSQIRNSLSQIPTTAPNLEIKIIEGIRLLLPQLLAQKVSLDIVYNLFTATNGLWAKFHYQVIQDIEHDLQLMSKFARSSQDVDFKLIEQSWHKIWEELKKYWQIRACASQDKYQAFAKLFEQLGYSKLSVIFYHIGLGKVPKNIFFQVRPNGWQCSLYGIGVEREITIPEQLILTIAEIGSIEVRVRFVILLVILSLVSGFFGGKLLAENLSHPQEGTQQAAKKTTPAEQTSPETTSPAPIEQTSVTTVKPQITPQTEKKAKEQFATTQKSVKAIVDSLTTDQKFKQKIVDNLFLVLKVSSLDYQSLEKNQINDTGKKEWVKAIYLYQTNRLGGNKADGILEINTANKLKEEIIININ